MCISEAPRNYVYIYMCIYLYIDCIHAHVIFFPVCIIYIYFIFIDRKKKKNGHQVKRRIQDGRWGLGEGETFDYTTHRDWAGKRKENKTKYSSNRGKKNEDNVKHFTHSKGYMNYIENRKITNNPLSASNAHFLRQLVMQGLGMSNVFPKCCSY